MPTITINIADRGTALSNRTTSTAGHMWFELDNGCGNRSENFEGKTMASKRLFRSTSNARSAI